MKNLAWPLRFADNENLAHRSPASSENDWKGAERAPGPRGHRLIGNMLRQHGHHRGYEWRVKSVGHLQADRLKPSRARGLRSR